MMERERGSIKFEIVKRIGVLNTYPTGWSKEFNIVKWNDKSEKYDVRDWSPGHERMSRGVTLYESELKKMMELCSGIFEDGAAAENTSAQPQQEAVQQAVQEIPPQSDVAAADRVAEDVPF